MTDRLPSPVTGADGRPGSLHVAVTRADGRLGNLRIAVTGASGFCGGVVARTAAAAGARVVCLGRRPGPVGESRFWDATRTVPDLTGTDLVLHLAAAVGDPPPGRAAEAAFRAVNVDGTARLLKAAAGRPVVWVSSASVYAPPGAGPIREDHPLAGLTAYGRTKAAGERLALEAGAVVLRPRAVYGPGDPHLLPRLRRAVRGGRALLPGPDIPLSLTAVENLADACLTAHAWPSGAYNIADAPAYRRDDVVAAACGVPVRHLPIPLVDAIAAIATSVARVTRREPALSRYAVEQLTTGVVLDISRAREQGWTPHRTFADFLPARP
ncbi:NAD-dependent epimerase/dehydratase family protein [Actinoplanes sp. NPDC024001]|uniref:NAD-dependent epimerase/dehydratase family protein n=1 Tax=Actinoplanes sp. NPDC024001 TaxID=3154598 RepID=UPI0033CBB840